MTPAVVDTDVVPFLFKNDSRAQSYLPLLKDRKLLVSLMTEAELEQWILLAKWGASRAERFQEFVRGFRPCLLVTARANGRRIEVADAWIAATALLYGAVLITHNTRDYVGVPNLDVLSCA
jgi:predicted nucleic acid-binding protein